jgi:hypothetical protein
MQSSDEYRSRKPARRVASPPAPDANCGSDSTTTTPAAEASAPANPSEESARAAECIEHILRQWLLDCDLTVFCGVWSNGAIMELLPKGRARLTGQLYSGRFAGLRDLVLDDGGHHVHLDLGRLSRACYVVTPSVCYGFRPAFELRITAPGADPLRDFGLGLAMRHPYDGVTLRPSVAATYFGRAAADLAAYPGIASLRFEHHPAQTAEDADWQCIDRFLLDTPELGHLRRFLPTLSPD